MQGLPLVTLWPLLIQVHRTVEPAEMLSVRGTNWRPSPTVTSYTAFPLIDGTAFGTRCPFWSKILIGSTGRGGGVGRPLGVGRGLGVTLGVAVGVMGAVAVGVAVGAIVGVAVGVGVTTGVTLGDGVGVEVPPGNLNAYTLSLAAM